ncbi:SCP-like protein [Ostertagia ostertagi]
MLALATITYLTLLVTSGWASMCSDADGMNDELRQVFVDQHNMYRSQIAKGQAKNKLGGYAPKAARMLKMTYDCDVEANTMQYVKKCVFEHARYSRRSTDRDGSGLWTHDNPEEISEQKVAAAHDSQSFSNCFKFES